MTKGFPREEQYGLISQARRAAVSIAANITEGHKRKGRREFSNFLAIAESSLEELKYYCLLSRDLGYTSTDQTSALYRLAEEVGRMLHGLYRHINKEVLDATPVR